mmetsp:Transcript_5283/g.12870  ORF Transcript_5283/g.12870 Transcript_5283/m.12870 type:complete len:378 (-) Transcript_5283:1666-2799(-)
MRGDGPRGGRRHAGWQVRLPRGDNLQVAAVSLCWAGRRLRSLQLLHLLPGGLELLLGPLRPGQGLRTVRPLAGQLRLEALHSRVDPLVARLEPGNLLPGRKELRALSVLLGCPKGHLRNPSPKPEGRDGFAVRAHFRRDVHEHHRLGLPAQAVLQELCQLAVPVRDVGRTIGERVHHVPESAQALVDVLGLLQPVASSLGSEDALAAGQVDQVQAGMRVRPGHRVAAVDHDRQDLVAAARPVVHLGLAHRPVPRPSGHDLQHVLRARDIDLHGIGDVVPAPLCHTDIEPVVLSGDAAIDEQIPQCLVVYLEHLNTDGVLPLVGALRRDVEEVVQAAIVDAAPLRGDNVGAAHGVRLPRAGLAVRKYADVVAVEDRSN